MFVCDVMFYDYFVFCTAHDVHLEWIVCDEKKHLFRYAYNVTQWPVIGSGKLVSSMRTRLVCVNMKISKVSVF
jgi:hypothetical protein